MAEINIERKKRPVWPWIFLILLVALLVWGIYELTDSDVDVDVDEASTSGMLINPGELHHYAQWYTKNTLYLI